MLDYLRLWLQFECFLKKAIAKGEMEIMGKGKSTPNLNTQVDRLWIEKMQPFKLNEVFGK